MTKLQDNLKQLQDYAKNLERAKRGYVAVGLPQEKVGDKIYGDGMTIVRIGAIHEFGASFTHPGGTPYKVVGNGKAVFLKKGDSSATGVTKPHNIKIPQRSFLRIPMQLHADQINDFISEQFADVFKGKSAEKALGIIGVNARNISVDSFSTNGYGLWDPIKSSTKKAKGSSAPLIDTGTLRNSITYVVRGI